MGVMEPTNSVRVECALVSYEMTRLICIRQIGLIFLPDTGNGIWYHTHMHKKGDFK